MPSEVRRPPWLTHYAAANFAADAIRPVVTGVAETKHVELHIQSVSERANPQPIVRITRLSNAASNTQRGGIISLSPEVADPGRLLAPKRVHWVIENHLHRRINVTFGEDASQICVGQGPTAMALLRDAAVSLLHRAGIQRVAERLRHHSQHPTVAVALVLGPLPTGA